MFTCIQKSIFDESENFSGYCTPRVMSANVLTMIKSVFLSRRFLVALCSCFPSIFTKPVYIASLSCIAP